MLFRAQFLVKYRLLPISTSMLCMKPHWGPMHFAAAAADATNELPNVAAPPLPLAAAADLALHSSIAEERERKRERGVTRQFFFPPHAKVTRKSSGGPSLTPMDASISCAARNETLCCRLLGRCSSTHNHKELTVRVVLEYSSGPDTQMRVKIVKTAANYKNTS